MDVGCRSDLTIASHSHLLGPTCPHQGKSTRTGLRAYKRSPEVHIHIMRGEKKPVTVRVTVCLLPLACFTLHWCEQPHVLVRALSIVSDHPDYPIQLMGVLNWRLITQIIDHIE